MPDVNLVQTLNSQSRNIQIDAQIITLDDNLFHPYFTLVDISKDNLSPIGSAIAKTIYAPDILKYWNNYTGTIIISFNMKELKHINTNSEQYAESAGLPQRIQNDEYNYSFIGKISKLKHKGKEIIIYFEDLGWKFLQKVPMEFRQQYIAGQPLDKAFQAMCEFLGVEFAYSISDLQEYSFGPDGYSVQKDGKTIETVETILSEWKTEEEKKEEEEQKNNPLDSEQYENPSLIEFDNKNKDKDGYERNEKNKNNKIVEQTSEEEAIDLYQEEFDKKILNLFIGNTYYESRLTDNIMDYGSITISPTTNNNTTNDDNSITETNDDQNGNLSENLDPGQTNIGLQNLNIKNTQQEKPTLNKHSQKSLDLNYIRGLTTAQAAKLANETGYYDPKTIKRLRRRAIGAYW